MNVHNHGPAEGRGLDCGEYEHPAHGLRGHCMDRKFILDEDLEDAIPALEPTRLEEALELAVLTASASDYTLHGLDRIRIGGRPVTATPNGHGGYNITPFRPDVDVNAPAPPPPPVDPTDVTWPGEKFKVFPARVVAWDGVTDEVTVEVDHETARRISAGMVGGFSIRVDPNNPRDEVHVEIVPDLGKYGRHE